MFPWKTRSKSLTGRNKSFYPNIVRIAPGAGSRLIWYDKTLRLATKHNILEPIVRKKVANLSQDSSANEAAPETVRSDSSAVKPGSPKPDSVSTTGSSSSDSSMERHFAVQYQHNDGASQYSGSSALDRCYVGGKGFSRFLKHQVHPDIWSDSATETSFLRSSYIATTTQGAPYSSSDLIGSYSSDTRLTSTEDIRLTNGSYSDRPDRRGKMGKDSSEGRPSSRKNNATTTKGSTTKAALSVDKEKEREKDNRDRNKDIKDLEGGGGTILPPTNNKVSHTNYSNFRPMNARNNFLGGQQINPLPSQQRCSTQQSSNTNSSHSDRREPDDLVAMGTNPSYGRGSRQREGSFSNGNGLYYSQSSSGALGSVRKFSKPNAFTRNKDSEPRYSDPLVNAPPTFNQRIAEITSLEQETIRYERTKKFRKKKSETT